MGAVPIRYTALALPLMLMACVKVCITIEKPMSGNAGVLCERAITYT